MKRVLLIVAILAGVICTPASASPRTPVRPNAAFDSSGNLTPDAWEELQNPSLYPPPNPIDGVSAGETAAVFSQSRALGGVLPSLRAIEGAGVATGVARFALGSVALSIGSDYALQGYGDLYDLITNGGTNANRTSGGTTMTPTGWYYVYQGYDTSQASTTQKGTGTGACSGGPTAPGITTAPNQNCAPLSGFYLSATCAGTCFASGINNWSAAECSAVALTPAATSVVGSSCLTSPAGGGTLHFWYATDAQMEASFARTPTSPAGYTNQTNHYITNYNLPASSDLNPGAAAGAFGNPGSQTDAQKAAELALAEYVAAHPGGGSTPVTSFTPFVIPEPQPSETYRAYLDRLREHGWIGTVTVNTVGSDSSLTGPEGVVSVENTTQGTGPDTIVGGWPDNALSIKTAGDALTLTVNSTSATPLPGSSCGSSGSPCYVQDNTASPGDSACDTCAIDWTPIEDLDVGTKFPFGVPTWFHDFFNGLSFSSSCSQSLDLNESNPSGSPPVNVSFCSSEWESTYRPIVFPILEALMTLAAVTFLGVKIFGMGGGDNG